MVAKKPKVLLVVMDGVGMRDSQFGNAVAQASTSTLDSLQKHPLFTTIFAHGTYVGLPSDGDIGNSEVGHNALGAGRVFAQGATLVNQAIESGRIFEGKTWKELVAAVKSNHSTLHLIGLVSDGNVHSHESHLYSLIAQAKKEGVSRVRIHVLLDGRDVAEKSAEIHLKRLAEVLTKLRDKESHFDVEVASGGGRMVLTMDRYDADWRMVEKGWKVHVLGQAEDKFSTIEEAVATYRKQGLTDQYLPGFVIVDEKQQPKGPIQDGDGVVFFNFRGDRAIEISKCFTDEVVKEFDRIRVPKVYYAGMMEYDGDLHIPPKYLVSPPLINHTLSEYLIDHGLKQFACSETQKFGHVTFFWNGNRSGYLNPSLEEYVEVPSDRIALDQKPFMKAKEIADMTIDRMLRETFDFGRINFANADMVGHTGNLQATIQAVEQVDRQLARLLETAEKTGTTLIITADHGNADEMFDGKEKDYPQWDHGGKVPPPKTSHTLAPVPFVVCGPGSQSLKLTTDTPRSLSNVAATVIEILGLPPNPIYRPSLVKRNEQN